MKSKSFLALLFVLFILSCNSTSDEDKKLDVATTENHSEQEAAHNAEHTKELSLNNGVKWQTDESTRTHVAKLNALIDAFNSKENADIASYHAFAGDMQKELNELIRDCKMQGADHDALHLWLQPVLQDVSKMKKVKATGEGKHLAEQITNNVKKFDQYFN